MKRALEKLSRNIKMVVARGVVEAIKDSEELQQLQVSMMADETADQIERLQNYGFASRPLPGSTAALVFVGGYRDQGLAVAVDDSRHRPKDLEPGEVKIYTNAGDEIYFTADNTLKVSSNRKIEIEATDEVTVKATTLKIEAADKIEMEASDFELDGDLSLKGKLEVDGTIHSTEDVEADGDCISAAQGLRVSGRGHAHLTLVGNSSNPLV